MRNAQGQGAHQHNRAGGVIVKSIAEAWGGLLSHQPRWVTAIILIPALYGLGWLMAQPIAYLIPGSSPPRLSLIGTVITFVLFILVLPSWVRQRWNSRQPWLTLGVRSRRGESSSGSCLIRGLLRSAGLLALICLPLLLGSWGRWLGELTTGDVINALLLCFGLGLAEELLFRGWLWGELNALTGPRTAVIGQAAIFSLAHTRFDQGVLPMVGLLTGLLLLGLILAVQRRLDSGCLWGCVGLHGGLVGGWFALRSGLLQVSPSAPEWLIGPGGAHANPLGGLVGIIALSVLLWRQLTALAKAARP